MLKTSAGTLTHEGGGRDAATCDMMLEGTTTQIALFSWDVNSVSLVFSTVELAVVPEHAVSDKLRPLTSGQAALTCGALMQLTCGALMQLAAGVCRAMSGPSAAKQVSPQDSYPALRHSTVWNIF